MSIGRTRGVDSSTAGAIYEVVPLLDILQENMPAEKYLRMPSNFMRTAA